MTDNMKKKTLPLYELIISETDLQTGVDYISTVQSPAIQSDFIFLSSNEQDTFQFRIKNKEKKILMGAVAIPGLKIYRNNKAKGEYEVFFSKDSIEKIVKRFFKNGNVSNFNLEHSTSIPNLTLFESWLVADNPKQDKSYNYGFRNLPAGTWMISVDCSNNPEYWNQVVKTGEVRGFSLEGFFNMLEESFCSAPQNYSDEDVLNVLKETAIRSAILFAERKETFADGINEFRWEQWMTQDDEACPICLSLSEMGWQPGGALPRLGQGHPKGWKSNNTSCRCWKLSTPETNLSFKRNKFEPIDLSKVKSVGKNAK